MTQRHRAVLKTVLGEDGHVPANVLGKLREDLLGSGVHVHVASLASFDNGTATYYVELISSNAPAGANLQDLAQAALNEIYGEPEAEATPSVSEAVEQKADSSEPAQEPETPASSVTEIPSESSTEQPTQAAITTEQPKPTPAKSPTKNTGRKPFNIGKPAPAAQN